MTLPYTAEVWFAALAEYYATWFPGPVLMALAALSTPVFAQWGGRAGGRATGAVLAGLWIWVGAVHQVLHMATLDFMAPAYGAAWIVGGILFGLHAASVSDIRYDFVGDARGRTGLALVVLGLVAYPLAVLAMGYGWQSAPLAGAAPDPTVIFTAGMLLALRRQPRLLFVVPALWAGVAGVSAYLLDFPLFYAVPAAVVAALAVTVWTQLHGDRA